MIAVMYPFRFDPLFRIAARPFGVNNDNSMVEVHGDEFVATFGRWTVRTPLRNIERAGVTGPYARPKVIGPARLGISDGSLTFATNSSAGTCITFHDPVRGIDPLGIIRHRTLTVTVSDPAGLAELLDRPSHDPRRVHTPADAPTAADLVDEVADELDSLTAAELRNRAKERGIAGTSRLQKRELIELLSPGRAVE